MMKTLFIICCMSLAVMATSDQKELEDLLHNGNSRFTANMFSEVSKTNPKKSFVLSAYSVMTPLAQLGLASVGESHDELLNAIGLPNDNVTREVFSMVNTKLRAVKDVTLKVASKIYVAKGFELNSEFVAVTRDTFDSEVQNLDFNQKQNAANEVNTWVEDHTNKRIKDLVDPDSLSDDTRALLVNAIYFKGLWDAQFDKALTREKDFHVTKNDKIKVSMMNRRGDYKYTESAALKSQVIEIPYKGHEASLVIVLPLKIEDIDEVQEMLKAPTLLDKALSEMYEVEVDLSIPRFKIETTTDLKDILTKMNVKKMFSPAEARLDNLLKNVKDSLYIASAIQKAFIEVNEEGAEAAAANEFNIHYLSAIPAQPIEFKADHPFFYFLLEGSNILFNGVYCS
ncbi:antichymotrypsin-2-like isoform X5 [Pararge aegeria]|uniref:antichymotrypsin-2-like isoform X5 n=1 Tax=Pararge aegeria TaxID=116150 RepID=UPI0019D04822|nr:antichymotrypsin-2-like isoform X5 [Pararge aegeria]XP_039748673.1 antichymotrypsin-2-like isoform X5 [Pararge aegeria]